jgi:hypothetical protein
LPPVAGALSAGHDVHHDRDVVRLHRPLDSMRRLQVERSDLQLLQVGHLPAGMTCGGVPKNGACGFDCACH